MMNIRRQKHRVPALNTTSTADISFMLLIFFLVASSMDVDKGLSRQLPPADNQQKQEESAVNKNRLMTIKISAQNELLIDDKPMAIDKLHEKVESFILRLGKSHMISLDADPKSDYNTYFNVQNELVRAYKAWRDATARKVYHRPFGKLTNDEKEKIKDMCPQRIAETYNLQEGGAQ
jgi:biopolymer transport protein ExbD